MESDLDLMTSYDNEFFLCCHGQRTLILLNVRLVPLEGNSFIDPINAQTVFNVMRAGTMSLELIMTACHGFNPLTFEIWILWHILHM